MVASLNGHPDIVNILAENGAELDLTNDSGASALMLASQNNDMKIVKMLLDKGANPGLKDNTGKTAMDYAAGLV